MSAAGRPIEMSPPLPLPGASRLADLAEMTKPRAMIMVCATAALGFVLADPAGSGVADWGWTLFHLLVGTYLAGGGSIALNQCWEHGLDRRMDRTRNRPLATGRLSATSGWAFAWAISIVGVAQLAIGVNTLTAVLAAITHLSYVFAYTPLKRRSPLCTLVGAVPGAIPPMMGWTAVRGELETPAWILFAILFLWQMPHALAIGWIHRDDYARAGFRVLATEDPTGIHTRIKIAYYSLALLVVSLLPRLIGMAGTTYFFGALVLGVLLLLAGLPVARTPAAAPARRLLIVASVYLVGLMGLMVFDRV